MDVGNEGWQCPPFRQCDALNGTVPVQTSEAKFSPSLYHRPNTKVDPVGRFVVKIAATSRFSKPECVKAETLTSKTLLRRGSTFDWHSKLALVLISFPTCSQHQLPSLCALVPGYNSCKGCRSHGKKANSNYTKVHHFGVPRRVLD